MRYIITKTFGRVKSDSMLSILYVDDEPGYRQLVKIYLEEEGGFKVDTAGSAKSALTKLEHNGYDAVVSDYQMPEMDGITFLKKLRSQSNFIPFIVFSGNQREEVSRETLEQGADCYVPKSGAHGFGYTELIHQIRRAVQRRQVKGTPHRFSA